MATRRTRRRHAAGDRWKGGIEFQDWLKKNERRSFVAESTKKHVISQLTNAKAVEPSQSLTGTQQPNIDGTRSNETSDKSTIKNDSLRTS